MATYNELEQRIDELKSRTGKGSISPRETFDLMDELLAKTKGVDMTAQPLVVVKSYDTLALANADRNPINPATNKPLVLGQLVSITADGTNNAVYRLASLGSDGSPTWEKQAELGDMTNYTKSGGSIKTTARIDSEKVEKNPGKNLYDSTKRTDGVYLFFENGAYGVGDSANYFCTDFILIGRDGLVANREISGADFVYHVYYDARKNPISHTNSSIVPYTAGASFVRFCFNNIDDTEIQIERGSTVTEYEPYNPILAYIPDSFKKINEKVDKLIGRNLYNPLVRTDGLYLYYENGSYGISENANYSYTDYISIDENGLVTNKDFDGAPFVYHVYYNNLKKAIGRTQQKIVKYLPGAAFVRFCFRTTSFNMLQIERGDKSTTYLPYSEVGGYVEPLLNSSVNLHDEGIGISLPDRLYAVVGDTLQLFIKGIVKAVNPYVYDIVVNCPKGRMYPRYFEYTPTASDVGTTTFEIKVKNSAGVVLISKRAELITKAAKTPTNSKKVLFIGDSLTNARIYPVEAFRRLTEIGGIPAGLGFQNISFVGRKPADYGIGVEGNSGWSWVDFATRGRKAYLFTTIRPDVQPSVESVYKDENGNTYTSFWLYSPTSVKMLVDDGISIPPPAGTLTKVSGGGADTIVYTSCAERSGNPFWSDILGGLSFKTYVDRFCGGSIDVVYVLLTWNGVTGNMTDFSVFINYARTLFNHIKSQYPSIKIKLLGVQLPDQRQGMGLLGAPAENTYTDQYGLTVTALNMNDAYQSFANEPEMSSFVEFVNVSSQIDSEYNMPYAEKAVNTRNSTTELVGTNDVHPDENGYKQIADVVFRNFVANFCQ